MLVPLLIHFFSFNSDLHQKHGWFFFPFELLICFLVVPVLCSDLGLFNPLPVCLAPSRCPLAEGMTSSRMPSRTLRHLILLPLGPFLFPSPRMILNSHLFLSPSFCSSFMHRWDSVQVSHLQKSVFGRIQEGTITHTSLSPLMGHSGLLASACTCFLSVLNSAVLLLPNQSRDQRVGTETDLK